VVSEHRNRTEHPNGERALRKIARSVEEKILRRWFEGNSQRQVASEFGVGLATVNRVIQDAKKRMPDIDDLRQLNLALQKSGVTVVDAMRACSVLPRLDELGIGINELSGLITEETAKEVARLEGEKTLLEGELKNIEKKRSLAEKDLKDLLSTKQTLHNVGLDKVADLARFINEFETLRFSAKEVRELAQLKKELDAEGIRLGTLRQHFQSARALKLRLETLQREIEGWETKLKLLARIGTETERNIRDTQRIQFLMNMRKAFTCGYCGSQFFHELRRLQVSQCLATGQPIIVNCQRCGAPNTYNPYEVLARLGFEVLS